MKSSLDFLWIFKEDKWILHMFKYLKKLNNLFPKEEESLWHFHNLFILFYLNN
jgi:hypothetical protein